MATQKTDQIETQAIVASQNLARTSCPEKKKKKSENATFLGNVKDRYDGFIHASMDEKKSCFKQTIKKVFGTLNVDAETSAETKEIENSLHRWAIVADF